MSAPFLALQAVQWPQRHVLRSAKWVSTFHRSSRPTTEDPHGARWHLPHGTSTFTSVSCPTDSVCFASADQGIFKSTDGGISWSPLDSSFPAVSISCFTADQCTAVEGSEIDLDGGRRDVEPASRRLRYKQPFERFLSQRHRLALPSACSMAIPTDIRNPERRQLDNSCQSQFRRNSFSCLLLDPPQTVSPLEYPFNKLERSVNSNGLTHWSARNDSARRIAQCRVAVSLALASQLGRTAIRPRTPWDLQTQWEYVDVSDHPANAVDLARLSLAPALSTVLPLGDTASLGSGSIIIGNDHWVSLGRPSLRRRNRRDQRRLVPRT